MTDTFERLCAILVKEHKLPAHRLMPDTPLDSLGIDSLATVELLWHVEDDFKIKLPSDPVDLPTLGDVVRYVDAIMALGDKKEAPAVTAAAGLLASSS